MRIMFFGDLVGKPGRAMFQKWMPRLKKQYKIDSIVINGENAADNGKGITPTIADFLLESGVSIITTGNHIWAHKNIYGYLDRETRIIRPANFHSSCPGVGYAIFEVEKTSVAIINLQGRIFMRDPLDCPFRVAESLLSLLQAKTNIIFVDFHAEATSEKEGLGFFLDGRVSAVLGTHTHVQTADERILPQGTGYITDLGFAGSINSMLGMRKNEIINKLVTQMPTRFIVETSGLMTITGVWLEIDTDSGKTTRIERFNIVDDEIVVAS